MTTEADLEDEYCRQLVGDDPDSLMKPFRKSVWITSMEYRRARHWYRCGVPLWVVEAELRLLKAKFKGGPGKIFDLRYLEPIVLERFNEQRQLAGLVQLDSLSEPE